MFSRSRSRTRKTPYTRKGLFKYDGYSPEMAVILAWAFPGPEPRLHREMQQELHDSMPLLARALDRLAYAEGGPQYTSNLHPSHDPID